MPRRARVVRRETVPDAKYGNRSISRMINKLMVNGKKSLAERLMYQALERVEDQMHRSAADVFEQALRNATPVLEVKPRRVGGATYQVPVEIRGERRISLAMRWLVSSARSRPGRTFVDKLAGELMDAAQGTGATVKRRDDVHRMAEANKAFAHYRW
jgi:small subunit ribosomal protein S7